MHALLDAGPVPLGCVQEVLYFLFLKYWIEFLNIWIFSFLFLKFQFDQHYGKAQKGNSHQVSPDELASALEEVIANRDFYRFSTLLDEIMTQPIDEQFQHYDTILRAMGSTTLDEKLGWPRVLLGKICTLWENFDRFG